MLNAKELEQKLTQIHESGDIKSQEAVINVVIQHVRRAADELREEVQLAKDAQRYADDLKRLTKANHGRDDVAENDRLAEQNAQDMFDRATRAKRHIDQKKQTLRALAHKVEELRKELHEFAH